MSRLIVNVDYIKVAQYVKTIKQYVDKIEHELEGAVMDRREKRQLYCSNFNCIDRGCDDEKMVE